MKYRNIIHDYIIKVANNEPIEAPCTNIKKQIQIDKLNKDLDRLKIGKDSVHLLLKRRRNTKRYK